MGDHRGFRSNRSAAGARFEERTHAPNGLRLRAPMTIQPLLQTVNPPAYPLLSSPFCSCSFSSPVLHLSFHFMSFNVSMMALK